MKNINIIKLIEKCFPEKILKPALILLCYATLLAMFQVYSTQKQLRDLALTRAYRKETSNLIQQIHAVEYKLFKSKQACQSDSPQ